jgi:hypothetical protein
MAYALYGYRFLPAGRQKTKKLFNSISGLEHYDDRSRIFRAPGFAA